MAYRRPSDLSDFTSANILDSRDVQARIDELETLIRDRDDERTADKERLAEEEREAGEPDAGEPTLEDDAELAEWKDELNTLNDFKDEVGSREWDHGLTLIGDSYFEDYARELAEDIGADAQWPATYIDWPAAAAALKGDYSSADLEGETFWYNG